MKPTNPKITWQPYPATRPTEAGDYFVTLECEDKGLGIFTFILPFIPQRGRFFYKLRDDKRVLAWAPLTTAHLIRYDEEKPKPMDSYMVKLATPDAALPFTYCSLFYGSNNRFFVIKEKKRPSHRLGASSQAVHGRSPMKKLNEIDWFFIIVVLGFAALAVSFVYAVGKIITEVIRWGF